jgi:hypothetical protein
MSVVVQLFTRTPFDVQAVEVTTANIGEVALWCNGTIESHPKSLAIKLDIPGAKTSVRQHAFPGDWILLSDQGYRIYTKRALESNFSPKTSPKLSPEQRKAIIRELVYNAVTAQDELVNPNTNVRIADLVEQTTDGILRAG